MVLTYLAVVEAEAPGWGVEPVRRQALARGSATGPPPAIEVGHVIEHGLRHLSWLVRDDPVISDLLRGSWRRALDTYEPEPFRALGEGFAPEPGSRPQV